MKKWAKRITMSAGALTAAVFGWIWIGGYDCEPPMDDDLLLLEDSGEVPDEDNAFVALTNLANKLDSGDGIQVEKYDFLSFFVDPEENIYDYDLRDMNDRWTNNESLVSMVESALSSNQTLIAIYDRAASMNTYRSASAREYADHWDDAQLFFPCGVFFDLNRTILPVRIKLASHRGDFDKAVSLFRSDVELAKKMRDYAGSLIEYLVGEAMIQESLDHIAQFINEYDFPDSALSEIDDIVKLSEENIAESCVRALKKEYAIIREYCHDRQRFYTNTHAEHFRRLPYPIACFFMRYIWQPNRTLIELSGLTREFVSKVREGKWSDTRKTKRRSDSILLPNGIGKLYINIFYAMTAGCTLQNVKLPRLKLRMQIASICHQRKFGKKPERVEDLAEYLGEYPKQILGDDVIVDLEEDEIKCGECSESIGTEWTRYFPLVMTNGCYYTRDLSHIVGVAKTTETIVIGADVKIDDGADFSGIKKVIVKPECDDYLEKWYDALSYPTNLEEVCFEEGDGKLAQCGNLIYERGTGRIVNIVGNEKDVIIPAHLVVSNEDCFVEQLCGHNIERVHFCGPLPDFNRRKAKDVYRRRIARWWKYKDWKSFWRIFEKEKVRYAFDQAPTNLIFTVSRQNADDRTYKIVESGMWEGRPIKWSEEAM